MPSDKYKASEGHNFASYMRGWRFAEVWFSTNRTLTLEQLEHIVDSMIVPKTRISLGDYQLGFEECYRSLRESVGNLLPAMTQEREDKLMGKLSQAKEATTGKSLFVKADQLNEQEAVFCIRNIRQSEGNFGPQWILDIEVTEDTALELGIEQNRSERYMAAISFSKGVNGENSRDRMLSALNGQEPVHNVKLAPTPMKTGQNYWDFEEVSGICACGVDETFAPLGDLDEHPF